MLEAKFCPRCGTPLRRQRLGDRTRPVCPDCGWVHYANPIVAAGTLVDHQGRALLIRRGVAPGLGRWGLPAGYAEAGETPEQTAIRETREEAGVEVGLDDLLGIYTFSGETLPSGVLILYAAHIESGHPHPGDDATEVRFFAPTELPDDIAFDSHRQALAQWARASAIRCGPATPEQASVVARMAADQDLARDRTTATPTEGHQGSLLVATDGSEVVGFLSAVHDPAEGDLRIRQVYVLPSYRRWGIGTRLVGRARGVARREGLRHLLARVPADNPGLIMFLRAGFRVCGFLQGTQRSMLFLCHELERPDERSHHRPAHP